MNNNVNTKQHSKNVLFILSFPPPHHGANEDNLILVENWNSNKNNPLILDISNHNKKYSDIGKFRISNLFTIMKGLKKQISILKKCDIDIVFSLIVPDRWGFIRDSVLILTTKIFSKAKVVTRFPAGSFYSFYRNSFFLKPLIKTVINLIDLVITEGDCINWQFKKIRENIQISSAYPGIPDRGNKVNKLHEQFNVLYICYHRKAKGFYDVLYSIPDIVQKNPKIKFNFVGKLLLNEKEQKRITKFVEQNTLTNNIIFHGEQIGEEKWEFYRDASVQILPSYSEGLPTSIIEGLSFGLPIIATRVGVIPEIIKEGINGFLLEPGDTKKLTELIIYLSQNPAIVEKIGFNNRKYYLENFIADSFCKRIEACLDLV